MQKRDWTGILGVTSVGASSIAMGQGGFTGWEIGSVAFLVVATLGVVAFQSKDLIIAPIIGSDNGEIQRAEVRDSRHIFDLARQHFGENVTGVSQIKAMIKHNRDMFWVLLWENERRHTVRLCGYFCIIPLSAILKNKAERNELNILTADLSEIPRRFHDAEAVYFGGIVSATYAGRAKLLACAEEKAQQFAHAARSRRIYARAGTTKGLKLMEKRGFAPVVPFQSGLHALFVRELETDEQEGPEPIAHWPLVPRSA
jgi:hypothetical protein